MVTYLKARKIATVIVMATTEIVTPMYPSTFIDTSTSLLTGMGLALSRIAK